jgi:hypothetical protein
MKHISFIFLFSIICACKGSDVGFEDMNIGTEYFAYDDSSISVLNNKILGSSSKLYRISQPLYTMANYQMLKAVLFAPKGELLDNDICWAYFPDKFFNAIVEKKNLKKDIYKVDSSFLFYINNIKNCNTNSLIANEIDSNKYTLIIFWKNYNWKGFQKIGFDTVFANFKRLNNFNVFFVNADIAPYWNADTLLLRKQIEAIQSKLWN